VCVSTLNSSEKAIQAWAASDKREEDSDSGDDDDEQAKTKPFGGL